MYRRELEGQGHAKGHQGTVVDQGKGHKMMQYVACPKTARIGSDWEELHQMRETVQETDKLPFCKHIEHPDESEAKVKDRQVNNHEGDMQLQTKGQKVKCEGQEVKADDNGTRLPRAPGFGSVEEKEYRSLIITCSEMHLLLDNGKWNEFTQYGDLLLSKFADSVDMKIHVLHHMVDAQCVANNVSSKT